MEIDMTQFASRFLAGVAAIVLCATSLHAVVTFPAAAPALANGPVAMLPGLA